MIAALGFALLSAVRLVPASVSPTYTVRDTSRALGPLLADVPLIGSSRSEGLFNDNNLRYRSVGPGFAHVRPDAIVITFAFKDPRQLLEVDYCLVKTYALHVSSEYRPHVTQEGSAVRVWLRRPSARCPA